MASLRKELILRREAVTNRTEKERAIVERLLPFLEGQSKIGVYLPMRGEVNVYDPLLELGFSLWAPRINSNNELEFRAVGSLERAKFGMLEPGENQPLADSLDVIIVPLVAFTGTWRLGYGGGYYDRFLKNQSCLTIGVAFNEQESDFKPNPWDIPLDFIITPVCIKERRS